MEMKLQTSMLIELTCNAPITHHFTLKHTHVHYRPQC